MKSKVKCYNDKIAHYQKVEVAYAKIGDLKQAGIAKKTIEHYQELLNSQK